jgi:hypothetical protein
MRDNKKGGFVVSDFLERRRRSSKRDVKENTHVDDDDSRGETREEKGR